MPRLPPNAVVLVYDCAQRFALKARSPGAVQPAGIPFTVIRFGGVVGEGH